jgi:predicted phosphodiesterase
MTRYGIVADVHGNLAALEAAVSALDSLGVTQLVSLGDTVGYNPHGNECAALLARRRAFAIAGNHDLIALGVLGFERCADKPTHALRRTRRDLDRATRSYLRELPRRAVLDDGTVLVHGSPDDVSEYLTTPRTIERAAWRLGAQHRDARVCFFGHTHEPRAYTVQSGTAQELAIGRIELARAGHTYFVNPGAVDASRCAGVRCARFAVWDDERRSVTFLEAPYDSAAAEQHARARGYRMGAIDAWIARGRHRVRDEFARLADSARAHCRRFLR